MVRMSLAWDRWRVLTKTPVREAGILLVIETEDCILIIGLSARQHLKSLIYWSKIFADHNMIMDADMLRLNTLLQMMRSANRLYRWN